MPTIEFNKEDFLELVGEELTDEEIEEKLARVKVEVEEIEDDRVEVEITSDRIDLLSVEGIARSLRTHMEKEQGLKDYKLHDNNYEVKVEDVEARPEIVTAVVKDVKLDTPTFQSLIQLQEKLHATHGRDRKRVAIGIHDIRNIEFPLTYQSAETEEHEFIPLEKNEKMDLEEVMDNHEKGKKYKHLLEKHDKWPLITDKTGQVLSFPPVINSRRTEVSTASEDLFIDVTGTDRESVEHALNVIVTMLAERGGKIHKVKMNRGDGQYETPDFSTVEKKINVDQISDYIGIDLDKDKAKEYLQRMGYGVIEIGDEIEAVVPPYRSDILHQVDIAEDIAIGFGYNNIEPVVPNIATTGQEEDIIEFENMVRETMTGLRFQEVVNPTLRNKEVLNNKVKRDTELVEIENAVSEKYTALRDSLIPQLLETLSENTHNTYPQKVFETADVVLKDESQPVKTRTDKHLAGAMVGKESDYTDIRENLEGMLESVGVEAQFKESKGGPYIDGRCAKVILCGEEIGKVGEIDPEVLENFGMDMPVAAFEIDLEKLRAEK
ncbi:MAG: phenylalanine--tRNA ligase subunit beta [Candidatus Nanohaloarchaeota archaeon QJJ-9]|nr:phenylalanine--tRNA ligase subunit beta [Candidatus Nanohaloarchaeota archaeon QJJ-9]